MNTQLTNQELINLWTSQNQPKKENKQLHFEGKSLYNSKNVELARFIDNETIFISYACPNNYSSKIVNSISEKNMEMFYVKSFTEHQENIDYYKTIIDKELEDIIWAEVNSYSDIVIYLGQLDRYIEKMKIIDTELNKWIRSIKNCAGRHTQAQCY